MKPKETKHVCDLISLVANAIASGTIPEAQDYMLEKYDDPDDEVVSHAFQVLTQIQNKQQYDLQSY
jgi:hypothetical protein